MKTLSLLLMILAVYFLCVDHIRPCRRQNKAIASAVERGDFFQALEIPHRILHEHPCLCSRLAKESVTTAFNESMAALLRSDQAHLQLAVQLTSQYQQIAREDEISNRVAAEGITEELAVHALEAARVRLANGETSSSLLLLDEIENLPLPDTAEIRQEAYHSRLDIARFLSEHEDPQAAIAELERVVTDKHVDPELQDEARQLAGLAFERQLSFQLAQNDLRAALQTINDARQIVHDDALDHLFDSFDLATFGQPLRGTKIALRSETLPVTGAEVRIHNASKTMLFVLLRGPSREALAIPPGGDKLSGIEPGDYAVGAYCPSRPSTQPYRGFIRIHNGLNFSGFTEVEGGALRPASNLGESIN